MSSTLIDLTPFGSLLQSIGLVYWGVCIALVVGILVAVKRLCLKLGLAAVAATVFAVPAVSTMVQADQAARDRQRRSAESLKSFEEHCKTAGQKIYKTVEGVDRIRWKWRSERVPTSERQYSLDDPYGRDCSDEGCISLLLRVSKGAELYPEEAAKYRSGYRTVEALDPRDGRWYQYEGHILLPWTPEQVEQARSRGQEIKPYAYTFRPVRTPIDVPTARYSLVWEDLSTPEDRALWIAGSALKLIDLQAGEVLGERIGYMVDRGLGDTSGFRDPWGSAQDTACPAFPAYPNSSRTIRTYRETLDLATQVAKPSTD